MRFIWFSLLEFRVTGRCTLIDQKSSILHQFSSCLQRTQDHDMKFSFFIDLSQFWQYIWSIQSLNDHIVEISIKYIDFRSVQSSILQWSYRFFPSSSVHWIYWEDSIRQNYPRICRFVPSFSSNSTEFTSISIISEYRNVCGDVQCDYVMKNTTTCSGKQEKCVSRFRSLVRASHFDRVFYTTHSLYDGF